MKLSARDRRGLADRYRDQYARYGYSPKALGWDKGKQRVRLAQAAPPVKYAPVPPRPAAVPSAPVGLPSGAAR